MSKTVPDISVIVVNYNYAKYIGDALESIKCQSLKNIECIIIDDASTDNSIQIIRKYTQQDKRFILVQQTSHDGVSAARNRGLDIARGRYIAFLDSDDCFTEYALEMLLHMAETTGADMAGGATNIVADKFRFIPSKNHTWIPNISGSSNNPSRFLLAPLASKWCWIWRRIYRRELIGNTRFRPEFKTFGDDLTFMLDICYRANLVVETQNISVYHRTHPGTITSAEFSPQYFEWFPMYFRHIRKDLLDKYDFVFWRMFYQNTFTYLMLETIYKPKKLGQYQTDAKSALIASCREIPRRYLRLKQKFLCWFLSCLK